jgi:hypothetical protein
MERPARDARMVSSSGGTNESSLELVSFCRGVDVLLLCRLTGRLLIL